MKRASYLSLRSSPPSTLLGEMDTKQQQQEGSDGRSSTVRSRLSEIWSHYRTQLDKIDDLEKRLDDKASHARRRIASLLDQAPTHRMSHLRVFVTHKVEKQDLVDKPLKFTLVIEGRTLVGSLDHESAAKVEQEGAAASTASGTSNPIESSNANAEGYAAAMSTPAFRSTDRSQYRTVGEKEEDPVDPVFFTHFFEKAVIQFQTIYQPISPPNMTLTPKKKSRSTKRKKSASQQPEPAIHPRYLTKSKTSKLVWTKDNTPDAHAFFVSYCNDDESDPPPHDTKLHSVVASISLFPTRTEPMYKPSALLADSFFPKHRDDSRRSSAAGGNKRQKKESGAAVPAEPAEEEPTITLENDIYVPSLLTMDEIVMALFQYIQDKRLHDPSDQSLIQCDKVLSNLFECETLRFSELRRLLLSKNLIMEVAPDEDPILLAYVMTERTASPQEPYRSSMVENATGRSIEEDADDSQHQVLSFDMDVSVPVLYHYRTRELLRRIKRREFEYTSSRTKARYMLVASRGNEDLAKNKIEQAVSGRGYSAENIPVFLALAKAAPAGSEARMSAQTDSRICSLMERVETYSSQAEASWNLVEACRKLGR